ncbi:MAG: ABC transporter permease [Nocardioides sp.]|uniref:ABC transporter permease n=1 Tax=Nocardioides sp. TaxID=35761 RepID=UPI0039E45A53
METTTMDGRAGASRSEIWRHLRRWAKQDQVALVPVLVIALVVGSALQPAFMTQTNMINVLRQSSELSVVVLAETLILLTGRFDLSLESTVGLAPMVGAWLVCPVAIGGSGFGLNPWLALLAMFATGAVVGAVNGALIVGLRLNAFMATLAMLILLRGITIGLSDGKTLYDLPASFTYIGSASWLGVPTSVWIAGVLYLLVGLFLRYHRVGRAVYAIGGNSEAARAAGIRRDRIVVGVYVAGGGLAVVAGLMLAGRLASVTSSQGQNMIFTVFAAAVIGRISLNGGRGTVLGALLGVLLLGLVSNILTLSNIQPFWINAAFGAIILLALIVARFTTGEKDQA